MRKLSGLFLMLVGTGLVQAIPVTWYLNGVTFNDSGRAVGSFVFDAATNAYSNINIFTTPGNGVTATSSGAGGNYTVQSPAVAATATQNAFVTGTPPIVAVTRGFELTLAAAMTDAGGTIAFSPNLPEGFCAVTACNAVQTGFRVTTGGSIVANSATGPQTWYLKNMTFDDTGIAMGSFVYDAVANTYSNVDIWVTGGSTFAATRHYTVSSTLAVVGAGELAVVVANPAQAGDRALFIGTNGAKTNAAGTLLIGGGGTIAEVTCAAVNCTTFGGPLRQLTNGLITTVRPNGYAKILSDVVDGSFGGSLFQTTIIATNLSDQQVAFNLDTFQDNGAGFNVPGIGGNSVQTIAPRGVIFLSSTGGTNTGVQGWARARGAENVALTAIFTQKSANAGGDVQNVVSSEPVGTGTFSMAFDNTNGAVGGFALTNPDANQAMKVLAVGYDTAGNIILNDSSITLNPLSHTAFNFQNQAGYNVLVNKKGLLRIFAIPVSATVTAPLLGLDGLMIKFLPNSSTATIQAVHE